MFMHRRERVEPVPASVPGSTVADIVEGGPVALPGRRCRSTEDRQPCGSPFLGLMLCPSVTCRVPALL